MDPLVEPTEGLHEPYTRLLQQISEFVSLGTVQHPLLSLALASIVVLCGDWPLKPWLLFKSIFYLHCETVCDLVTFSAATCLILDTGLSSLANFLSPGAH